MTIKEMRPCFLFHSKPRQTKLSSSSCDYTRTTKNLPISTEWSLKKNILLVVVKFSETIWLGVSSTATDQKSKILL